MQKRVLIYLLFLKLCFHGNEIKAQDPQLSQFYASPIYTNPAFTGASRDIRFAASARTQYVKLSNNYRSSLVSADFYSSSLNSGFGLLASYDVAGDGFLTTTGVSAIYSYNFNINRQLAVNAAIQGGLLQKRYDFGRFIFLDMIDPIRGSVLPTQEASGLEQREFLNFSAGGLIYSSIMYGGIAIHNLMEPNQSFYYVNSDSTSLRLPRRYTMHGGLNIYLTESREEANRLLISPNLLFMKQREFYQMNIGFYVKQKALTVGTWLRQTSNNADAVIFLLGLRFPNFRVGYSYDFVVSSARTATVGSHEIALIYEIKPKQRSRSRIGRPIKCPDF